MSPEDSAPVTKKLKLDTTLESTQRTAQDTAKGSSPLRPPVSPITPTPAFRELSAPVSSVDDPAQETAAQETQGQPAQYSHDAHKVALPSTAAVPIPGGQDSVAHTSIQAHIPHPPQHSQSAAEPTPHHPQHTLPPQPISTSQPLLQPSSQPQLEPQHQRQTQPPPQRSISPAPPPPPETTYITQPASVPIDDTTNTDMLALQSAISILQHQRSKSLADISTLSRLKNLAAADPDRFVGALYEGKLKADTTPASDPLRATFEGTEHEDTEEAEGKQEEEESGEWPRFPAPQNVIRAPPVNWAKYHIVGSSLDRMHEEQLRRPTGGVPSSAAAATTSSDPGGENNYVMGNGTSSSTASAGVGGAVGVPRAGAGGAAGGDVVMGGTGIGMPGQGHAPVQMQQIQQSERDHHVFAPYSPFLDKIG